MKTKSNGDGTYTHTFTGADLADVTDLVALENEVVRLTLADPANTLSEEGIRKALATFRDLRTVSYWAVLTATVKNIRQKGAA